MPTTHRTCGGLLAARDATNSQSAAWWIAYLCELYALRAHSPRITRLCVTDWQPEGNTKQKHETKKTKIKSCMRDSKHMMLADWLLGFNIWIFVLFTFRIRFGHCFCCLLPCARIQMECSGSCRRSIVNGHVAVKCERVRIFTNKYYYTMYSMYVWVRALLLALCFVVASSKLSI